jgi:hypothetical protein
VTVLQPFQLKNGAMAKGSGDTPLAKNVSTPPSNYPNGAHYRLPWAVSRELQAVAMLDKELYFKVTDDLLKDTSGAVKTGFDFEFSMADGKAVPYVIHSHNGTTGTLMGVIKPPELKGSASPTRGYLYFSNPAWTVSKEEPDQTFPNATSVLFLPSRLDKSGAALDLSRDLPTSDKVIVNPGALCDGDEAGDDYMTRNLTGSCGVTTRPSALVLRQVGPLPSSSGICTLMRQPTPPPTTTRMPGVLGSPTLRVPASMRLTITLLTPLSNMW